MKTVKKTKKAKKVNHNFSKFLFEGEKFGKGRLVLAIVKRIAAKNPKLTLDQINEQFSRTKTHSSFDLVMPVDKAPEGRYFVKEDAVVKIKNKKVAVTNQWGTGNITNFLKIVRKMGFSVRSLKAA